MPDVCKTSAVSAGAAKPVVAALSPFLAASEKSRNAPTGPPEFGTNRNTGIPNF